jgi:predicted  nucleic acid-binding Zn-ribbon protein
MNRPQPTPDSRVAQIHARLEALTTERADASTDLVRAETAVTDLLTSRGRPPREMRRRVQRDRDRAKTRLVAIESECRQLQAELAALHDRVAAIRVELAQLSRRDDPVTAGLTIAQYSERFFALQRELRDLVGAEPGAAA